MMLEDGLDSTGLGEDCIHVIDQQLVLDHSKIVIELTFSQVLAEPLSLFFDNILYACEILRASVFLQILLRFAIVVFGSLFESQLFKFFVEIAFIIVRVFAELDNHLDHLFERQVINAFAFPLLLKFIDDGLHYVEFNRQEHICLE